MAEYQRLSDGILGIFEQALDQGDKVIAELLAQALTLSLTRNTGGKNFVERRSVEDRVLKGFDRLDQLKKKTGA